VPERIQELIRICLAGGDGKQAKDIIDFIMERVSVSRRSIEYELTNLVEKNVIFRKKPKHTTYPLYYLKIEDLRKTATHRLYLKTKKGHQFFDQRDINDIIERNWDEYTKHFQKNIKVNSSLIANTIINFLWIHKKLEFAELSGWFGHSKSELAYSKKNKQLLQKYIQRMFLDVIKTDQDIWHNMIHCVHDIIDEERILTKKQIKTLWKA